MMKYIETKIKTESENGKCFLGNPFSGYSKKHRPNDIMEVYKELEKLGYEITTYSKTVSYEYTGAPVDVEVTKISW